jgi:hypothetical protein
MAYLSVQSVRRIHSDSRIVLFCDVATHAALRREFPVLLDALDGVIDESIEGTDQRFRSRYLKSRIREAISGDLIFLDVDTLAVRPFDDIAGGPWDLAAVQDRNHHCPIRPCFPHWRARDYERLGWQYPLPKFFNSGVMFWRDNASTRKLSELWQRLLRELVQSGLTAEDQFALNSALCRLPELHVHELDTSYNAMIAAHPRHARRARVYHFFAGNTPKRDGTLLEHLITVFDAEGRIDWEAVDLCVSMDHPWMPPYWPRRLWQTGNRLRALWAASSKLCKKTVPLRT